MNIPFINSPKLDLRPWPGDWQPPPGSTPVSAKYDLAVVAYIPYERTLKCGYAEYTGDMQKAMFKLLTSGNYPPPTNLINFDGLRLFARKKEFRSILAVTEIQAHVNDRQELVGVRFNKRSALGYTPLRAEMLWRDIPFPLPTLLTFHSRGQGRKMQGREDDTRCEGQSPEVWTFTIVNQFKIGRILDNLQYRYTRHCAPFAGFVFGFSVYPNGELQVALGSTWIPSCDFFVQWVRRDRYSASCIEKQHIDDFVCNTHPDDLAPLAERLTWSSAVLTGGVQ